MQPNYTTNAPVKPNLQPHFQIQVGSIQVRFIKAAKGTYCGASFHAAVASGVQQE